MRTIIGVMGPGEQATEADRQVAYALGKGIAEAGWVLLTGGRPVGVMDAASRGAKSAGGLTIGILPSDRREDASDTVDLAIVTGMGNGRNIINVLSSAVIINCGLGSGTASEVALAIKTGKPVVLVNLSPMECQFFQRLATYPLKIANNAKEAIALASQYLPSSFR